MNFLPVRISADEVRVGNSTLVVIDGVRSLATQVVSVGVRPEHLQLVEPGTGAFDAVIDMIEPLGPETLVHARATAQTAVGARLTIRIHGRVEHRVGDTIALTTHPQNVHLFDALGKLVAPPR